MKRIFYWLFFPIRALMALSKLVLVLMFMGTMALTTATMIFDGVFGAVSTIVESVTNAKTVRKRQAARQSDYDIQKRKNLKLETDNARLKTDNARLSSEIEGNRVTYRGRKMAPKEAVELTSKRMTSRVKSAAGRNIASMPAEALPFVGIAVVAAATAWEVNDACEMLKDMHELDVALNPENAIEGTGVCGVEVPTKAELWESITSSPGAAWEKARELYAGLPEVSFSGTWAWAVKQGDQLYRYVIGE